MNIITNFAPSSRFFSPLPFHLDRPGRFPWLELVICLPSRRREHRHHAMGFLRRGHQGEPVYAANGCAYCHTQQVRPPAPAPTSSAAGHGQGRGWQGCHRRTYPRDYIWQGQVFLGNSRDGADLSNVAQRFPDAAGLYRYLYDPYVLNPHSSMPRIVSFSSRANRRTALADALVLPDADALPPVTKLCPRPRPNPWSPTCFRSRRAIT